VSFGSSTLGTNWRIFGCHTDGCSFSGLPPWPGGCVGDVCGGEYGYAIDNSYALIGSIGDDGGTPTWRVSHNTGTGTHYHEGPPPPPPPVECTSGACCDSDGYYKDAGTLCSGSIQTKYGCYNADVCGADVRSRTVYQVCTGGTSSCTGSVTELGWSPVPAVNCALDQICSGVDSFSPKTCDFAPSCVPVIPPPPVCGNGLCEGGETCSTCVADCGSCLIDGEYCDSPNECIGDYCVSNFCSSDITYCGDTLCEGGEDCSTCSTDCGCPSDQYCSGDATCVNQEVDGGSCATADECVGGNCVNTYCSSDITYCGDNVCEGSEDCSTCVADCGDCLIDGEYCDSPDECIGDYCVNNFCSSDITYCGDNVCEGSEDCSTCYTDCGKCDGELCADADECIGGNCVHGFCSSELTFCGDTFCEGSETNADCPNDCCEEPVRTRVCPETVCTCDSGVRMCESDVDRACVNDMSNSCDCTLPSCFIVVSPTGDADGDGIDDLCDTETTQADCNDGVDNDGDGGCDDFGCLDIDIVDGDFDCANRCMSCANCGDGFFNFCDVAECNGCGLCSYKPTFGDVLGRCCPDDDQDTVCNIDDKCSGEDDRMDADDDGTPDACDTENNLQDCNDGIDNDGNGKCDYEGCVCEFANDYCGTGDLSITSLPSEPVCATYCPDDDQDTVCNAVDVCPGGDDGADADDDGTPDACDTESSQTDCTDGIDNDGDGQCDYFGCPGIAEGDTDCEYIGLPTGIGGPDMDGLPLDLPPDMDLTDYVDQINTQNQALLRAGCPLLY